jgi:hypothetical protein
MPDRDNELHKMARTYPFQEVVKELFRPIFPNETEENKDVRFILIWRHCEDPRVIKNSTQPHQSLRGMPGVPVVCLPFLLNNPTPPEDAVDYQLHLKAGIFLSEFMTLIDILRAKWFEATFKDIKEEEKGAFIAAAEDFAREFIVFTNPGEEAKAVIRSCIPTAFAQFLESSGEAKTRFLGIKAAYWALVGHSLTLTDLSELHLSRENCT